eukprot:CAMPEP_0117424190 /NCGR_PEP_ID=MMETSP0758-20121206/4658_1 /TAXON_ID=63605 /ORGANISM="Percolomonas cosmopolitus, Strain AE-1 (ATCC 50343)" /LENGTH=481 /DNA_ID=CAMNT_0005207819 /DNA_START=1 /DNA_END=1446 /DNA_ORIENTATION=-
MDENEEFQNEIENMTHIMDEYKERIAYLEKNDAMKNQMINNLQKNLQDVQEDQNHSKVLEKENSESNKNALEFENKKLSATCRRLEDEIRVYKEVEFENLNLKKTVTLLTGQIEKVKSFVADNSPMDYNQQQDNSIIQSLINWKDQLDNLFEEKAHEANKKAFESVNDISKKAIMDYENITNTLKSENKSLEDVVHKLSQFKLQNAHLEQAQRISDRRLSEQQFHITKLEQELETANHRHSVISYELDEAQSHQVATDILHDELEIRDMRIMELERRIRELQKKLKKTEKKLTKQQQAPPPKQTQFIKREPKPITNEMDVLSIWNATVDLQQREHRKAVEARGITQDASVAQFYDQEEAYYDDDDEGLSEYSESNQPHLETAHMVYDDEPSESPQLLHGNPPQGKRRMKHKNVKKDRAKKDFELSVLSSGNYRTKDGRFRVNGRLRSTGPRNTSLSNNPMKISSTGTVGSSARTKKRYLVP